MCYKSLKRIGGCSTSTVQVCPLDSETNAYGWLSRPQLPLHFIPPLKTLHYHISCGMFQFVGTLQSIQHRHSRKPRNQIISVKATSHMYYIRTENCDRIIKVVIRRDPDVRRQSEESEAILNATSALVRHDQMRHRSTTVSSHTDYIQPWNEYPGSKKKKQKKKNVVLWFAYTFLLHSSGDDFRKGLSAI